MERSNGNDSDVTARSHDKPFYVVRVACQNYCVLAKGYCDHNGINDVRSSALT